MWCAVDVCGARWSCVVRGGRVWCAMVVCGARWSCGRASGFGRRDSLCLCLSEETVKAVGPFLPGVYAR